MSNEKYLRAGLNFAAAKTIEECGELVAALGKTLCYGWHSYNPEVPNSERELNKDWVKREIEDVINAVVNLKKEIISNPDKHWLLYRNLTPHIQDYPIEVKKPYWPEPQVIYKPEDVQIKFLKCNDLLWRIHVVNKE